MENEDKVRSFTRRTPFNFSILPNSFGLVLKYAERDRSGNLDMGFPAYFVIDQDGIVRWRLIDLRERIAREFVVELHERSVGKLVRRLGFRRISVRPRHPEADAAAQEAHKKTSPRWSLRPFRKRHAASRSNYGGRTRPGSVNRAA